MRGAVLVTVFAISLIGFAQASSSGEGLPKSKKQEIIIRVVNPRLCRGTHRV